MSNKLLVLHAEGIGNFIQLFPLLRTLKEVLGFEIHYCHLFGSYNVDAKEICPYIDKEIHVGGLRNINPTEYVGKVSTFWGRNHLEFGNSRDVKLLGNIHGLTMDTSEVTTYLNIARDLGVEEQDIIWEAECNYNERPEQFDLVISNGYNKFGSARWEIKSYPKYKEVVSELTRKGLKVASIGSKDEYINGTVDMTGLSILDSFGVIKNSKLLISNDSGMYHAANTLSVPNVVVFTATSIDKNYDSRFHTYTTILGRNDLECRPCQSDRGWLKCNDWKCQHIEPEDIVKEVINIL